MSSRTDSKVLIGGKIYTLSGYESEEYLQKIASYLNNKIKELNQLQGYKRMSADMQKIFLELNIADDYFKAKKRIDEMEADMDDKDKAEYDLKHELISAQVQIEDAGKEISRLRDEIAEMQKQIVRLEASAAQQK
jgi:cell division protein ZapA